MLEARGDSIRVMNLLTKTCIMILIEKRAIVEIAFLPNPIRNLPLPLPPCSSIVPELPTPAPDVDESDVWPCL